ncbi:MAG: DUF3137 domain-containing protein [Ferruginibacter sp.]
MTDDALTYPAAENDFERFYKDHLLPVLPEVREACRQADSWGITGVVAFLVFFAGALLLFTGQSLGDISLWMCITGGCMLLVSIYYYSKRSDRFAAVLKSAIIKKILDHIYPGLLYQPEEGIEPKEYKLSGLYRYAYDYFDSDDLISGQLDGISFRCSEVHSSKIVESRRSSRDKTVFHGMFFVIQIGARFTGGTYVMPRHRGFDAYSALGHYYWLGPPPHAVEMSIAGGEFHRIFRVLSTWPSQAVEILDAGMQASLLTICRFTRLPVSFSFVAGNCYVAVPTGSDMLEPGAYDPGDKTEIKKYFISLQLIPSVIRQLNLQRLQ